MQAVLEHSIAVVLINAYNQRSIYRQLLLIRMNEIGLYL